MELTAAILLGFLGSLHCVGMCGPLALAVPIRTRSSWTRSLAALLYNLGRVFSYALMGAIFGMMGWSLSIAGLQQYLSIGMGIALILYVLFRYTSLQAPKILPERLDPSKKIQSMLSRLIRQNSMGNLALIGFLNGFLPCGLVYMAIAGAVAGGSALNGALFMGLFGLGTLPAMFSIMIVGKHINLSLRQRIRKAVPVILLVLAGLFLVRGMNLGIPYLSPRISYELNTVSGCH